jgi:putative transposase
MDYIHFNPVKHGFVAQPGDWPFSSFGRCVALGIYPPGWASSGTELAEAGERR